MINEKIRGLKKQTGLTAVGLSEKSGIPLPTIHKLLSGETTNPKYETLTAVVEALGYQLDLKPLKREDEISYSDREIQLISLYRQLSEDGQTLFNGNLLQFMHYEKRLSKNKAAAPIRELPLYLLPASAGIGSYLDSDQYEFKPFPAGAIPSGAKYAIRVTGDSMEPAYYQDEIVFIEPAPLLDEGDVGIIVINGEGYIKQYRDDRFISFNSKYPPIVPGEFDQVRIAGRVLSKFKAE
nr:XRE family transcriptional regulator [uncultured Acetobacterium sp.]